MSSSPVTTNTHHNYLYHDTTSSCSAISTSSSCSSPDLHRQQQQVLLVNNGKTRRKKRDFIPDEKKDPVYWSQRSRNNLSAKRSRVKRRMNDLVLETKVAQLSNENQVLRAKIDMLARKFGDLTGSEETNPPNEVKSEQPPILNILNQSSSSSQANQSDDELLPSISTEPSTDKTVTSVGSPMPMKWRLKLFNMTHTHE